MKLDRTALQVCAQECINTYKGEYGKVIPKLENREEFDIGKVEWITGVYNNDLYIVFRGSDGKADWADNIEYEQVPYNLDHTIQLHKGFYRDQYLLVREQILNTVFGYVSTNNKCNIIVSGHSLGGALAILAAFDIKFACNTFNVTCVALGAPRVGNSTFTKEYNKLSIDTHLYRHKNDSVTQVPFPVMIYAKKTCIKLFGKVDTYKPVLVRYSRVAPIIRIGELTWYDRFLRMTTNPFDHYPAMYLKAL